ncbi:dihydrolipoyl dehydrogenase family protein [Lactococcus garvieae]|uniref:dihydrolipoyl dehydrogenase family protein n=1 Tax=Lactococcus garvieae TaxID=1363 RepID=UPI0009BE79AD|nr:NAD(P)/FAD-dependent oxidoreductase [Lactococcus garvieae]
MKKYDYIVIGSGPGGNALAYALKAQGHSVLIVEKDKWGGTCPNYGCDPTKIMMALVETKQRAENLAVAGLHGSLHIDWKEMLARKNAYSDTIPSGTKEGLKAAEIDLAYGAARFTESEKLMVSDEEYTADTYIIATGARPRVLDIEGHELLLNSNQFLELEELPKHLIFLGSGYVSLELAQIANAAGSKVTVITHGSLSIKGFDEEFATSYIQQLQKEGITFIEKFSTKKVEQTTSGLQISAEDGREFTADAVVSAVGRVANIEDLNLKAVGIKGDEKGIRVNEFLQTANPNIYALGDVLYKKTPKLTPVSGYEARYLADYFSDKSETKSAINYPALATVIFGSSKLATIGQTEILDAKNERSLDMTDWYTYKRIADPLSKIKIIVNQKDEILGATILSTVAEELVNILNFCINQKINLDKFQNMIMAYPTIASDLFYLY